MSARSWSAEAPVQLVLMAAPCEEGEGEMGWRKGQGGVRRRFTSARADVALRPQPAAAPSVAVLPQAGRRPLLHDPLWNRVHGALTMRRSTWLTWVLGNGGDGPSRHSLGPAMAYHTIALSKLIGSGMKEEE